MKKIIVVIGMVMFAGAAMAQSAVRQSVKIPVEQVPLAVRQAYEKDFGTLPQEGYWMAFVESTADGKRTATTPLWYSYNNKKSKSEKIEIKFTPKGELTSVKGVEAPTHNASEEGSEKKTG
ncbi:MAG TPA: hypothetical protein VGK59_18830 [Ohtaekwangia sp.]